eukprot:g9747.t1
MQRVDGSAGCHSEAPRLRQTDVKKASLLAASAQHEGLPHGVGAPRPFGRSFHDAPVGNTDWVTHRQRIFVISDMDPTAPMDRLDGSSDHASLTGAMPAKPGGETVLTLDDGKPPMAPDNSAANRADSVYRLASTLKKCVAEDRMLSKRALKPRTFPERGGVLDRESPLSNEAVAPVDRVPPYVSRYLEQRANLEQNRNFLQEWTRADVNKDGVVSEEEFTMELKDRQAKKKDEIERLWQRFHQSEDKFMSKEEYFRLARTGYDLGTITRDDVASVMTPDNMKGLGYWGAGATCPPRSFVPALICIVA